MKSEQEISVTALPVSAGLEQSINTTSNEISGIMLSILIGDGVCL